MSLDRRGKVGDRGGLGTASGQINTASIFCEGWTSASLRMVLHAGR
jgi:hypothetical protein